LCTVAHTDLFIYEWLCIWLIPGGVWRCVGLDHAFKFSFSIDRFKWSLLFIGFFAPGRGATFSFGIENGVGVVAKRRILETYMESKLQQWRP
jgi:hypothetical protein